MHRESLANAVFSRYLRVLPVNTIAPAALARS
jgi:hypothetical protein